MKRVLGNNYQSTIGEERANTISHAVMALITLCTIPFATLWVNKIGTATDIIGVSIYMICLFGMFLTSTLYHMLPEGSIKEKFHLLDHIFIFITIASCYTPASLSIIGGWQGIILLCFEWAIVVFGIFYKTFAKVQNNKVSVALYIAMGWLIVFFLPTFFHNASIECIISLFVGGVLYTIGAIMYAKWHFKYHHFVWHLFINAAAICQFLSFVIYLK